MAITRGTTISDIKISANASNFDFSHTVDTGATLLLVYVGMEGNESIDEATNPPQWSLGGGEALTKISDSGSTGNNADCRSQWWGLVNPTAGAGTVRLRSGSGNHNPMWGAAVNYLGTIAGSVAVAVNVLSTDNNTDATSTAVHGSAGTPSSALIFGGHGQGQDMAPSSNATGFTEVFDTTTGGSNSADFACNISELLDAAPEAITVTWTVSDENCSIYLELRAKYIASGTPSITKATLSGAAHVWPRVYLNTTETKAGADEMTVTAANAAGTSITFDDPAGGKTGSLKLGVENAFDLIGWIDVTVNAAGAAGLPPQSQSVLQAVSRMGNY